MKKLLILLLITLATTTTQAKVTLPSIFSDNLVLQQQQRVRIWGNSDQKEVTLTPSWDKRLEIRTPVIDGRWSTQIETPQGSFTPYTLRIADSDSKITLSNLLIGEVWVCSGQSNMYMPLRGYNGQPVEESMSTILESPQYADRIRMVTLPCREATTPQSDFKGNWEVPSPETAMRMSAPAYFFARTISNALHLPVGIISTSWGGSKIESWMSPEALRKVGYSQTETLPVGEKPNPRINGSMIYNGLITPIMGYTARGFTWYQGESNRQEWSHYAGLMQALVAQWRGEWGDTQNAMPFYYVQISPYRYNANSAGFEGPQVVEAQLDAQQLIPNSAIIPTTDIGDEHCIHPANKRAVGERLAATALGGVYGMKLTDCAGPRPSKSEYVDGKAIVHFDNARFGLSPEGEAITGFELAGSDGTYHPATGRIVRGKGVVEISSPQVTEPKAVRYSFRNYAPGNLTNTLGWPAFPFRSDRN